CIPPVVVIDYFPSDGPTDSPSATISIAPVPLPTCANTYVAQSTGETCDSIGTQFGVSGPEILASNPFLDCQDIWLYTQICVPYPVISDSFTLASSSTTVI
ncbi:carbohydrate-binding module family 50 protein, partial [Serendipita vermifera MAFF 305830]